MEPIFQAGPLSLYWSALYIGSFPLRWYGLLIVGGALAGAWIASREAGRRGEDPEIAWDVFIYLLVAGILGARLYHVFSTPAGAEPGWQRYFLTEPWTPITIPLLNLTFPYFPSALAIWKGGLGIYGAILASALTLIWYTRRRRLKVTRWLDIGTYGLALGQAIGRWGNYFNQELYGNPTTLPWGIRIDAPYRLPEFADLPPETRFHPTFLYESLWSAGTLAFLLWISRRYGHRLRDGDITLLYLILYPVGRFLVEFQRPDAWRLLGLPTAQWIALISIIVAAIALWWRHRHGVPPEDVMFPREGARVSRALRRRMARAERG